MIRLYGRVGHLYAVDIPNMGLNIRRAHAFGIHGQDLLLDVLTDAGLILLQELRLKLPLSVPRDRQGEFEPQLLKKNQTSISQDIEEKILSMYAKGMSTSDIETHIRDIYGVEVSDTTVKPYHGQDSPHRKRMAAAAAGKHLRGSFHGCHPLSCPPRRSNREEGGVYRHWH